MKEILDSRQKKINYCGGGMVVLFTNEEEVKQTDRVQTGVDTFEDKDVTRYQYDKTILLGVKEANKESLVEALREKVARAISNYDKSDNVNKFLIIDEGKELDYWLDSDTRNKLVHSVTTWKEAGNKTYRFDLREYGTSIDIDCDKFLSFLDELENYTVKCFNTTSDHLNYIYNSKDIDEILYYDFKKSYPDKIQLIK